MPPRTTNLDEVSPDKVLRRIHQRRRKGLSMRSSALNGDDLLNLARFHFGGWYEAVAAAGLRPEGRPAGWKPRAKGVRRLRALTEELLREPLASAELERMTGVRAGTIRQKRRRMGIARDERRRSDRSWLSRVRWLLGTLPDTEIAERAGVSPNRVAKARQELGIPAWRPARGELADVRSLSEVPPREVLREIRSLARSGHSMIYGDVTSTLLLQLASFHFGGWYQAVEAAGLVPKGTPRTDDGPVRGSLRSLTEALLSSSHTSRELERMTGIRRDEIRARRSDLGIDRDERPVRDRSWVPSVKKLLGVEPDAEIARRVGVSPLSVGRVRRELGIPCPPRRSLSRDEQVRGELRRYRRDEIERVLARVGRRAAAVLRARVLAERPETLTSIGRRMGITKQSVRWHEQQGLARLLDDLATGRK